MNKIVLTSLAAFLLVGCVSAPAKAQAEQVDVDKAVEILGRSVAFDTVAGRGKVPAYAEYLASELIAGGFAEEDVAIEPFGETSTLMAHYAGRSAETPIVLNAHMDVVEADPADWVRDPFTMETDGTYFYGRGVLDNKYGLTMLVTTLIRLKREGFVPAHDIILVLTGDEETAQVTAAEVAPRFKGARMVLNADAGGGTLSDDGTPRYYSLQAGEKTYADFEVVITNPGGHSSRPTGSNAIIDMSSALERVAAYAFPPQTSELTQAYFRETAKQVPGDIGAAMARFAENPEDAGAVALLSAEPEYIGQIRTTCVTTQIEGGHAQNALPQRVTANINCRIFPGVSPKAVQAKLQELVGTGAEVNFPVEYPQSETSPLDAELMAAVRKAVDIQSPGLTIIPSMSAGTTDSLLFRGQGIPSYGVSGIFMKPSDDFAHGLNERVPVDSIPGALEHWHVLLTELAG
ncbi:MAG: M20/M25/M40 family metallo-hydrolase [Hyphomonas sp.]|uniref:M20/M25/M40 family metallo-hydrolase n=1 Tax=Hyphomonas sp. TaxID=87 RepID=UPI003001EA4F